MSQTGAVWVTTITVVTLAPEQVRYREDAVQDAFKEVMAHVATPVSVVTVMGGWKPYGATVSAFLSLSMSPPMLLVSLDRRSETLELISAHGRFGLNIMASEQHATALAFARKGGTEKFDGIDWRIDCDAPRILGTTGWVACDVHQMVEGGDHVIVVGKVLTADHAPTIPPLTYHRRSFGTHLAHDDWP